MNREKTYDGYVTSNKRIVGDGIIEFDDLPSIGYMRPHPSLSNTWIHSIIWRPGIDKDLYALDRSTRLNILDPYIADSTIDLVTYIPRGYVKIPFQLFGHRQPKNMINNGKWVWSIQYDGLRIGIYTSGYGVTRNGLIVDLRSLLPTNWASMLSRELNDDSTIILDAELLPIGNRTTHGHNDTMKCLHRNTINGLHIKIFDVICNNYTFSERYVALLQIPELEQHVVKQKSLDIFNIHTVLKTAQSSGFEGIVVRRTDQKYARSKRTGHAFKLNNSTTHND